MVFEAYSNMIARNAYDLQVLSPLKTIS